MRGTFRRIRTEQIREGRVWRRGLRSVAASDKDCRREGDAVSVRQGDACLACTKLLSSVPCPAAQLHPQAPPGKMPETYVEQRLVQPCSLAEGLGHCLFGRQEACSTAPSARRLVVLGDVGTLALREVAIQEAHLEVLAHGLSGDAHGEGWACNACCSLRHRTRGGSVAVRVLSGGSAREGFAHCPHCGDRSGLGLTGSGA
mmetsp:Transcript_64467/g.188622  ORF Transcript_64467/g.188622 Transcript_64467/m.188622 type:complete len:201 (+) Transcript_64467:204-806(+)